MKLADAMDMKGRLTIQKFNCQGKLLTEVKANNFIVYTGRDLVAKLFLNQKIDPIKYIAVGTGVDDDKVDPVEYQKLQREVFRKEIKPIDLSKDLTDITKTVQIDNKDVTQRNRRVIISADLDYEEPTPKENNQPYELREAGLFNASKEGVMYNRVVFPTLSKTKDFKLTLVWEIIF